MKKKKVINMVKSIKSAKLCLDGAIKRKKESQDITSHLYQFCLQLAKYCEEQDHKKYAKSFRQRAKIVRTLSRI